MSEITIKLPDDLSDVIAEKITSNMKDAYYWNVTKAVSDELIKKLEETGFIKNLVDKVYDNVVLNEKDFIDNLSNSIKESMLKTMSTMTNEIFNKVSEKVKSYGFIKIGN